MTEVAGLGFEVHTDSLNTSAEMMRLLALMQRIEDKPAAEQLALIRAHIVATYEDATEVDCGPTT